MVDKVWLHVAHHGETQQLLGGKHDERKHGYAVVCENGSSDEIFPQ